MGISAVSTQRSTATSAQSNQTVTIYTGSGYSVAGSVVKESTNISLGVVTPGQSSTESAVSVSGGPSGPTITSIQYLDANNSISDDTAVNTAGGNILINGSGFVANSTVYINNVAVSNTILSDTQIQATCPAASSGNVSIMIFTSSNVGTIKSDGVRYSGIPSWTTTSVSFQNNQSANVALVASGDSTLTYTLQAGSTLPTGITLNSAGYLEGTVTGYSTTTSSTAVLIATDAENQSTQQTLTWTVLSADPQFNYTSLLLNGDTGSNIVNGANNSVFLDSSTNAATITRAGNVSQGSFSPYSQNGWSNYFGGATGYTLYMAAQSAFAYGTGDFTIECWVNPSVTGVTRMIYDGRPGSTNGAYPTIYINSSNQLVYLANGTDNAIAGGTVLRGTWNHVALSRTSSVTKMFLNGTQVGSNYSDATNYTVTGSRPVIGENGYVAQDYFNGYMSNLRIVKGQGLYTGSFTPSTTPLTTSSVGSTGAGAAASLTGTVSLLTLGYNRLVDGSSNAFTIGKNASAPQIQAFRPFAPSSSYTPSVGAGSAYFDGTGDYLTVPNSTGNLSLGSGDFTWEVWIYYTGPAAGGTYGYQVAGPNTGQGSSGWGVVINRNIDTKGFGFVCHNAWVSYSAGFIPTNTWTHLAVTRTGSGTNNFKMFMNGVLTSQTTYTTADTYTATPVYIGSDAYAASPGSLITGYLSDMRFIKGNSLYTAAFTPPTTPLTAVANTTLLMSYTNGGIVDAHSTNMVETVGNTRLSTSVKKYGSASMYFDGTGDWLQFPASSQAISFGTGDFTVECWINFAANNGTYNPFVRYDGSGTFDFGYDFSTSQLKHNGSGAILSVTQSFTVGTWYHVAVTRASGSCRLFVNGTQIGTTVTGNTDNYAAGAFKVGGSSYSGSHVMNGYIDDLRITKGFARYTANFTAPENAFIGQ